MGLSELGWRVESSTLIVFSWQLLRRLPTRANLVKRGAWGVGRNRRRSFVFYV
ncbi:hypothetical protein L195_g038251, partial [Trifolium pratense]